MSSGWLDQATRTFRKELTSELRSRHALGIGLLFSVATASALGFAAFNQDLSESVKAGLLTAGLLFASAVTVPRVWLAEGEQGTLEALRLSVAPSAAAAGKLAFAALLMLAQALLLVPLLAAMLQAEDMLGSIWGAMLAALCFGMGFAFAGMVAAGANNRWALAAGAGLPLLLPACFLSIEALEGNAQGMIGLAGYALALAGLSVALAPWLHPAAGQASDS